MTPAAQNAPTPAAVHRPCKHPRCAAFAAPGSGHCAAHAPAARAQQTEARARLDDQRGSAHARGYDARWAALSRTLRTRYPLSPGYLTRTALWTPAVAMAFHALREQAVDTRRYLEFMATVQLLWPAEETSAPIRFDVEGGAWVRELRALPHAYAFHPSDRLEPAEVTDHIIPHRGDPDLFWAPWNLQTLSKRQHDTKTATEDGGFRGAPRAPSSP